MKGEGAKILTHRLTPVSHWLKAALGAKGKVHSNYPRSPQANTSKGCQLVHMNDSGGSMRLRNGADSICRAGNLSLQTWLGPATLLQFNTEAKMQKEIRDNVRPRNIDSLIKCLSAAYCKTEELVVGQTLAFLTSASHTSSWACAPSLVLGLTSSLNDLLSF